MPQFHLIRHAQSSNNALRLRLADVYNNTPRYIRPVESRLRHHDALLTAIGQQQAENLVNPLLDLCQGKTLVAVSPMRRAIATVVPSLRYLTEKNVSLLCHGLLYEVGGCHVRGEVKPGLSSDEIAEYFPEQIHTGEKGWFAERKKRETHPEVAQRVLQIKAWFQDLVDANDFDTVIVVSHGACIARLLRALLSTPDNIWICHDNTGVTSFLWDREQGFLLQGINHVAHIPKALQTGATLKDGWWPAVYKKEHVNMRFGDVPACHPQLYAELCLYRETRNDDAQRIFFCAFSHTALQGFASYLPAKQALSDVIVVDQEWTEQAALRGFALQCIAEMM